MAAVTLTTLRARARERADQVNSDFVADAATGLDAWINEGVQKLWEKLIKAFGEEFVEKSQVFTTTASDSVALPSDFFILYGVDLDLGAGFKSLTRFNRAERNFQRAQLGTYFNYPRYKLSGMGTTGVCRLLPAPTGVFNGKFWYAPVAPVLTTGTDTVDFPNGWERYVVNWAALKLLGKEESSTSDLWKEIQSDDNDLAELAIRRDQAQPHSAVDMDAVNADPEWFR